MRLVAAILSSLLMATGTLWAQEPERRADQGSASTFRTSVDLVSLSAVVRDRQGRIIHDLGREDFEVFDNGVRRPIVEFAAADDGPVSLAVLFDTSGSMRVSNNLAAGRAVVEELLALLKPGHDEVALYAFDRELRELQPFTFDLACVRKAAATLDAFGSTALYDAIGLVASQLDERPHRRRAMVVVTDGIDTSSQRSVAEVSGIASRSDVPVYVVVVGPGDTVVGADGTTREPEPPQGTAHLGHIAYWTGGALLGGRGTVGAVGSARAILAELRHQYLLAFESAGPGWRPVDVRLRPSLKATVRTRSAYQSSRPVG